MSLKGPSVCTKASLNSAKSSGAGSPDASAEAFREKIEKEKEETIPIPPSNPVPKNPQPETGQPKTEKVKEVPEDVLRKILE